MDIHKETGLSRVTIDKYIRYITTFEQSNKVDHFESIPDRIDDELFKLILPESYFTRKKRKLTSREVEFIQDYIRYTKNNDNKKDDLLTKIHRSYCKTYYKKAVSYASFYRVFKMMDIEEIN